MAVEAMNDITTSILGMYTGTNVANAIAEQANKRTMAPVLYTYPLDMQSQINQPFIQLRFYEWDTVNKGGTNIETTVNPVADFYLETPETNIAESFSHDWNGDSYDWRAGTAGLAASAYVEGVGGFLKNALANIGGESMAEAGVRVFNAKQNATGQKYDVALAQGYNGVQFRSFELNWDLVPFNRNEAMAIDLIVSKIKVLTSPTHPDNTTLKFPNVCRFAVYTKDGKILYQSDFCGVSKLDIIYGDEKGLRTYKDGYPVSTRMQMTLNELFKQYKQRVEELGSRMGSGE